LMHAICDSLLGAIGEADIAHLFPNTVPRWKKPPSKVFFQEGARKISFHNGKTVTVAATLGPQPPKTAPHIHAMQLNISQALGINPRRVGIKATTNEQLGFLGREEGIAAMAVAGVDLPQGTMGAKAGIGWEGRTAEGLRREGVARGVGGGWGVFEAGKSDEPGR